MQRNKKNQLLMYNLINHFFMNMQKLRKQTYEYQKMHIMMSKFNKEYQKTSCNGISISIIFLSSILLYFYPLIITIYVCSRSLKIFIPSAIMIFSIHRNICSQLLPRGFVTVL